MPVTRCARLAVESPGRRNTRVLTSSPSERETPSRNPHLVRNPGRKWLPPRDTDVDLPVDTVDPLVAVDDDTVDLPEDTDVADVDLPVADDHLPVERERRASDPLPLLRMMRNRYSAPSSNNLLI